MRQLAFFCLRQVLGRAASAVIGHVAADVGAAAWGALKNHLTDHGDTLPKALASANMRTWDALGHALNDGAWDAFKNWFKSADHKGITDKLRQFLQGRDDGFRHDCLQELLAARAAKLLSIPVLALDDVARETVHFDRYAPEMGNAVPGRAAVRGGQHRRHAKESRLPKPRRTRAAAPRRPSPLARRHLHLLLPGRAAP